MNKLNNILENIYDNDLFAKGYSLSPELLFIIQHYSKLYLVILMDKSGVFGNRFIGYEYRIYSLTDSQCVIKDSKEYKKLVSMLPSTNTFSLSRIKVGPNEMFEFVALRDSIVNEICVVGEITEELRPKYKNYLQRICEIYEDKNLSSVVTCFDRRCQKNE